MVIEVMPGIFQVAINVNGAWWTDDIVITWMSDLKRNKGSAYNSRRTYATALDIFLHYYIYNPQEAEQTLYDYLLDFREELRHGLTITTERVIHTDAVKFKHQYTVLKKKALKKSTINAYMTSIQWFLSFMKEKRADTDIDSLYSNGPDWDKLKKQSLYGKGGGYGLMMDPLIANLLAPKLKLIKNYKTDRISSKINSYFPPEIFMSLLELCEPREQAIYLLCGCAGTRIGQALSLTRDDYRVDTQEVYIIDTKSDEKGPSGTMGRFQMLQEYDIDMEKSPYKYIANKYPIPLQYDELLWITPSYKHLFFKALSRLDKGNPIQNKHPFIFNTKSGKILTPNECHNTFLAKINKLKKLILAERQNNKDEDKNGDYDYIIDQLSKVEGIHSLRHMYGIMWGDFTAEYSQLSIEKAELLCQYGMGHKSKSSVFIYFSTRKKARERYLNNVIESSNYNDYGTTKYWNTKLFTVERYFKRKI